LSLTFVVFYLPTFERRCKDRNSFFFDKLFSEKIFPAGQTHEKTTQVSGNLPGNIKNDQNIHFIHRYDFTKVVKY
jgi:hypothetical protein